MPKYDYSEYSQGQYEKYINDKKSTKDLKLDYSVNKVHISEKDKTVRIMVDSTLARRYEEMLERDAKRTDIDKKKNAEYLAQTESDEISDATENLQRLCRKFNISFYDDVCDGEEIPEHYNHEHYANALSGSLIQYPLGEGILDFCYFDIEKNASSFEFLFALLSDDGINMAKDALFADSNSKCKAEDRIIKFKSKNEIIEYQNFRWEKTLMLGNDFFYNSLFTAVFPPLFMDANAKAIKRYLNYLIILKKEFEEKIQFCFDMDFYPGLLGHLYPCERYGIYCQIYKDIPSLHHRDEEFTVSRYPNGEYDMPYGFDGKFFSERLKMHIDTESDEYKDFAERYDTRKILSEAVLKVPANISVSYICRSVFDMLNLEFTKILEADIHLRKCKRCGRYFIMKGNYDTKYCDRIAEGQTRSCQDLAAQENYKAKVAENPALPIYSKYYKRYAARVRSRQIKEADFKKWKYQAITKRSDCTDGKITVDEFVEWLEAYFPNRKPKE